MSKLDLSGLTYYNEKIKEKLNEKVNVDDVISIANGGTGATSESGARANLKNNLLTFVSFAQIGLPDTATIIELAEAMPDYSKLIAQTSGISQGVNAAPEAEIDKNGLLIITRINSVRIVCEWHKSSSTDSTALKLYIGSVRLIDTVPFTGWVRVYPQSQNQVITGSYTGDGTENRAIDLGVTPKAVLTVKSGSNFSVSSGNVVSALAVTNNPAKYASNNVLSVAESGFSVVHNGSWAELNQSGSQYNYTAWL